MQFPKNTLRLADDFGRLQENINLVHEEFVKSNDVYIEDLYQLKGIETVKELEQEYDNFIDDMNDEGAEIIDRYHLTMIGGSSSSDALELTSKEFLDLNVYLDTPKDEFTNAIANYYLESITKYAKDIKAFDETNLLNILRELLTEFEGQEDGTALAEAKIESIREDIENTILNLKMLHTAAKNISACYEELRNLDRRSAGLFMKHLSKVFGAKYVEARETCMEVASQRNLRFNTKDEFYEALEADGQDDLSYKLQLIDSVLADGRLAFSQYLTRQYNIRADAPCVFERNASTPYISFDEMKEALDAALAWLSAKPIGEVEH
jgi:hypothetical protein